MSEGHVSIECCMSVMSLLSVVQYVCHVSIECCMSVMSLLSVVCLSCLY